MFKLIVIETHGCVIIDGTEIHVRAAFNTLNTTYESLVAAYLYDRAGVLIAHKDAKINEFNY